MSEPLKDLGRQSCDSRDHRVLTRIAGARGCSLQELLRDIISEYVAKAIHDAKVVLGQDDDNPSATGSRGAGTEDHGTGRRAAK